MMLKFVMYIVNILDRYPLGVKSPIYTYDS